MTSSGRSVATTSDALVPANRFSMEMLERIIVQARDAGYAFVNLAELLQDQNRARFSIRLDLDFKPKTLRPFIRLATRYNVPMTVYVRAAGPYNPIWHTSFEVLKEAANSGLELGLHTAAVEWAEMHGATPEAAFAAEIEILRQWFKITTVAPHRDVNYLYNTLPWLEANWAALAKEYQLRFHAYDARLFENAEYVNEGLHPHLGWRSQDPLDVIRSGKSIYMLLHPHWWFVDHPFEHD